MDKASAMPPLHEWIGHPPPFTRAFALDGESCALAAASVASAASIRPSGQRSVLLLAQGRRSSIHHFQLCFPQCLGRKDCLGFQGSPNNTSLVLPVTAGCKGLMQKDCQLYRYFIFPAFQRAPVIECRLRFARLSRSFQLFPVHPHASAVRKHARFEVYFPSKSGQEAAVAGWISCTRITGDR